MSISISHKHTLSCLLPRFRDSRGASAFQPREALAGKRASSSIGARWRRPTSQSIPVEEWKKKRKCCRRSLLFFFCLAKKQRFVFFSYLICLVLWRPLRFAACPGSPLSTAAVRVSGFFSVSARVSVSRRASLSRGCETKQNKKKSTRAGREGAPYDDLCGHLSRDKRSDKREKKKIHKGEEKNNTRFCLLWFPGERICFCF